MNNIFRKLLAVALPLFVVALGIAVFVGMVKTKPTPKKKEKVNLATLVNVESLSSETSNVSIHASGIVQPSREIILQSQVAGRLTWLNPQLVPGGYVAKGDTLVKLDARDYQLNIRAQQSNLERARLELELEKGRQRVAEREFELFDEEVPTSDLGKRLALRKPQMENAKASIQTAQSQIALMRLNLSRTSLEAPFNATVQSEAVDVGQLVQPQNQLARLIGTDTFWVQTAIPLDRVQWISIPGVNGAEGSSAIVKQKMGDQSIERKGKVVRLLGDVDQAGQMARVLVEVEDPFNLASDTEPRGMPLLIGSFVDVEISGREVNNVVKVPRVALRGEDEAWIYADGTLHIRKLQISWRAPDHVLVSGGVQAGESIITSRVSTPVEGMKLRLPQQATAVLQEGKGDE